MKWLVLPLFLWSMNLYAQSFFWKEKELTPKSSAAELEGFIRQFKASELQWNTNIYSNFPCRLKNAKGNWQLYDKTTGNLLFAHPQKLNKMSVEFPTPAQEELNFTVVNYQDKKGVISFYSEFIPPVIWEEIVFENLAELDSDFRKIDSLLALPSQDFESWEIDNFSPYARYGGEANLLDYLEVAGKKDGKWYRIELRSEGPDILEFVSGLGCTNKEDLSRPTFLSLTALDFMAQMQKEHKLDLIESYDGHAVYCYGRSAKTHQWGVFGGEGTFELIAPIYDSVKYHEDASCFELWLEGKVFVYNMGYENLFEEQSFDGFEVVFLDYMYGVAVKSNNAWQLYDGQTGDLLVKGSAPTIDELIELWLNRFDEE
ncbi:hypothetical protein SAMN05216474_1186 [Lishizhenia tianjinensis]|uniref:Uncharacterized protein n=1 Tax=Lishizhenia tianjinensis TaxID=477690 RepID=A0A1I6YU53_9FLAO|nr:hypothetical protein [Lishizhenia tianjinensis]SFT54055.1 hypothetical protein SAMN05216474_1186 [Lishizhenia tianjinensis]